MFLWALLREISYSHFGKPVYSPAPIVPLSCFDYFPHVYSHGAGDGSQGLKQIKYVLHDEGSSPGLQRLPCAPRLGCAFIEHVFLRLGLCFTFVICFFRVLWVT